MQQQEVNKSPPNREYMLLLHEVVLHLPVDGSWTNTKKSVTRFIYRIKIQDYKTAMRSRSSNRKVKLYDCTRNEYTEMWIGEFREAKMIEL